MMRLPASVPAPESVRKSVTLEALVHRGREYRISTWCPEWSLFSRPIDGSAPETEARVGLEDAEAVFASVGVDLSILARVKEAWAEHQAEKFWRVPGPHWEREDDARLVEAIRAILGDGLPAVPPGDRRSELMSTPAWGGARRHEGRQLPVLSRQGLGHLQRR